MVSLVVGADDHNVGPLVDDAEFHDALDDVAVGGSESFPIKVGDRLNGATLGPLTVREDPRRGDLHAADAAGESDGQVMT